VCSSPFKGTSIIQSEHIGQWATPHHPIRRNGPSSSDWSIIAPTYFSDAVHGDKVSLGHTGAVSISSGTDETGHFGSNLVSRPLIWVNVLACLTSISVFLSLFARPLPLVYNWRFQWRNQFDCVESSLYRILLLFTTLI